MLTGRRRKAVLGQAEKEDLQVLVVADDHSLLALPGLLQWQAHDLQGDQDIVGLIHAAPICTLHNQRVFQLRLKAMDNGCAAIDDCKALMRQEMRKKKAESLKGRGKERIL